MHAVFKSIVVIRIQIAIVDGGQAIAPLQDHLHRPAPRLDAARFFTRAVIEHAEERIVPHPRPSQQDLRIRMNGLVAVKIQTEKQGRRFALLARQIK